MIRMFKTFAVVGCIILLSVFLNSKKLSSFQDYFRAPAILMDNTHLCIWDQPQCKIHLYSLRDYKKITAFGKRGQGPGEFIGISKVSLKNGNILVSSFPKLCIFNKKGELLKEIKGPNNAGSFIPITNNYIGTSFPYTKPTEENIKILFSLYDSNLRKIKDLFLTESRNISMPGKTKEIAFIVVNDCTKGVVYKDKLFIGSTFNGFFFAVFDHRGNKLYEISMDGEERKITGDDKKRILEDFKKSFSESRWQQFKAMYDYRIRDYYPAFANFSVDNDRIYVFKHPGEYKQDIIILDLKGNVIEKKSMPVIIKNSLIVPGRFYVKNGKLYYMSENEETEMWELHQVNIDSDQK